MPHEAIAKAYLERLNAADGDGVAALFHDDGTFEDPATDGPIPRSHIAAMVARVAASFAPHYEAQSITSVEARVVVEWRLHGKNVGPFRPNFEPSHEELALDGVDVLDVRDGRIRALRRYFDRHALAERAGMQVIVEPFEQDGAAFGYSMHVSSGNEALPGVIALTWIRARDEREKETIRGHSRQIIRDFRATPGIVTGFAGLRGFTVTAWEGEEALRRGISRHHASAKQAFHTTDLSPGVWTSVWKPVRTNRVWTRCTACTHPNDVNDDHRACEKCGAELPPRPTFW